MKKVKSDSPVMIQWVSEKGMGFVTNPVDEWSVGWLRWEDEDTLCVTPHKGTFNADENFEISKQKVVKMRNLK